MWFNALVALIARSNLLARLVRTKAVVILLALQMLGRSQARRPQLRLRTSQLWCLGRVALEFRPVQPNRCSQVCIRSMIVLTMMLVFTVPQVQLQRRRV